MAVIWDDPGYWSTLQERWDFSTGGSMGSMFAPISDASSGGFGSWGSLLGGLGDFATNFLYSQLPQRQGQGTIGYPTVGGLPVPGVGGNIPVPRTGIPGIQRPSAKGMYFAGPQRRYRHMNACNPRALRRAIRRVKRFEKFAKQSVKISAHVKKPRGRARTCR